MDWTAGIRIYKDFGWIWHGNWDFDYGLARWALKLVDSIRAYSEPHRNKPTSYEQGVILIGLLSLISKIPIEAFVPKCLATSVKNISMTRNQSVKIPAADRSHILSHLTKGWQQITLIGSYSRVLEPPYHSRRIPMKLPGRIRLMKILVRIPDVGLTPVPSYCSYAGRLNT